MNEKRFIGLVVAVGAGLALVSIVGIVISKNARAAAREKNLATLAAKLDDAVSKSNEHIRDQDFEQATMTLQAIEPSIMTVGNHSLKTQYDQALGRVTDAERDYETKLTKGWTVFGGAFVSPEAKQRILAERKQKREEDLRQAEYERQLAEARRQKDMAERQRREEQQTRTNQEIVASDSPSASERRQQEDQGQSEKAAYIANNLELYAVTVKYMDSFLDDRVPGVLFKLRNKGDRSLDKVEVTVFFKDANGRIVAEEDFFPVLVTKYSFSGDNKPLKPGYIWQMERGKFYPAKSVPSEWLEGAVDVSITDIRFSGSD